MGEEYLAFLKEALPKNLASTADYPNVEFAILAYGDHEVYDWVKETFPEEVASERIKLTFIDRPSFNMPHAKNVAHRCASEDSDILVNLDADNVLGADFCQGINGILNQNQNIFCSFSTKQRLRQRMKGLNPRGTGGRVIILREDFLKLHGYNEPEFPGWGDDDKDFIRRAIGSGLENINPPLSLMGYAIPHSNELRVSNMEGEALEHSQRFLKKRSNPLTIARNIISEKNSAENGANPEGNFGCGEVTVLKPDFSEEVVTLAPAPHPEWVAAYDKNIDRSQQGWSMG